MGEKVERKSRYCKKRSTIWVQKAENRRKSGTKIEILQKTFHYLGATRQKAENRCKSGTKIEILQKRSFSVGIKQQVK